MTNKNKVLTLFNPADKRVIIQMSYLLASQIFGAMNFNLNVVTINIEQLESSLAAFQKSKNFSARPKFVTETVCSLLNAVDGLLNEKICFLGFAFSEPGETPDIEF